MSMLTGGSATATKRSTPSSLFSTTTNTFNTNP